MSARLHRQATIWSAAVAGMVAIGCDRDGGSAELPPRWMTASADTQWVTIEEVEFPAGMEDSDPEILEAYVFAAKHPEVLRYMPCYCGCEDPRFVHESNYDCFVNGVDQSRDVPRVSPDAMGFS